MSRAADTEALLGGLDRFRTVKGTIEVFDALLDEDVDAVSRALNAAPKHPMLDELSAWLLARGGEPPRPATLLEQLQAHGITDVDAYVAAQQKRIADLEERLGRNVLGRLNAEKNASAYAGVTVILLAVACLGWLAAFGVISISGEKLPTIDDVDKPTEGATAAPERRK